MPSEKLPSIKTGRDAVFTYTNKRSGFYMGNSRSAYSNGHYGWNVSEKSCLLDYFVFLDGQKLQREKAAFEFWPHFFRRDYGGLAETFFMPDGVDALCADFTFKSGEPSVALVTAANTETLRLGDERFIFINGKTLGAALFKETFGARLVISLGESKAEARELLLRLRAEAPAFLSAKKARLGTVLDANSFSCGDKELEAAAAWSRLSLDSLITHGRVRGIWAGLPWFNNYWGRDTFISLPGAALSAGNFALAEEILSDFARYQLSDEADALFGRIPNLITEREVFYNTADASKWFVLAVYKLLLYSGDAAACSRLFASVEREIEGALLRRADENFFITHGEAETWMDAVGPTAPRSPRGNRAVEIQALWHAALSAGAAMAELSGRRETARKWRAVAGTVKNNFLRAFLNPKTGGLYDHLNSDGSADLKNRPNQIFAVTAAHLPGIPPLLDRKTAAKVCGHFVSTLLREDGVLSLSEDDPDFREYHDWPGYSHKDEAYHNGVIWTWLAGPAIESMALFGMESRALALLKKEAGQILNLGCLGGFTELIEPRVRPGNSSAIPSGAVNQAWSLAEFQRNIVSQFAGYQPDAPNNNIRLSPLSCAGNFRITVPFKNDRLILSADNDGGKRRFLISRGNSSGEIGGVLEAGAEIQFSLPDGKKSFEIILPLV